MPVQLKHVAEVPVYTQAEVDALLAALPGQPSVTLPPAVYPFFGPVQSEGANVQTVSPAWQFPGAALTASTQRFYFDMGMPHARLARWVVIWQGTHPNNVCRLVHMDDGPLNIVEMARVAGQAGGPVPFAADVTTGFNALVDGGVLKNLGIQFYGDGVSQMTLYASSLQVVW